MYIYGKVVEWLFEVLGGSSWVQHSQPSQTKVQYLFQPSRVVDIAWIGNEL